MQIQYCNFLIAIFTVSQLIQFILLCLISKLFTPIFSSMLLEICFRCSTKGDEDYRPLFENFVQDLLSTVNKPEWPAAELLLSLLGRLLVS